MATEEVVAEEEKTENAQEAEEVTPHAVDPVVTDTVKAVVMGGRSFKEMHEEVEREWAEKYGSGYVAAVHERHAIVLKDGNFWKVPYERNGDDISLSKNNEWVEVEPQRGFTEKFIQDQGHKLTAIKSLGEDRVGAYAILWGDENKRDLHKQFFTKNTQELTSILDQMGALPYMFQHGADGVVKSIVMGQVDTLTPDEVGLWFEAKIREHEAYKKFVAPLMEKQVLYPSSGVLPAAMRVKKNGEITRWPIVEVTGTNIPAEHRMLTAPISELNKMYKMAGLPEFAEQEEADGKVSEKETLTLQIEQRQRELRLLESEQI